MENNIMTFDKLPDYRVCKMNITQKNGEYMWVVICPEFWEKTSPEDYNKRYIITKYELTNKLDGLIDKEKVYLVLDMIEI